MNKEALYVFLSGFREAISMVIELMDEDTEDEQELTFTVTDMDKFTVDGIEDRLREALKDILKKKEK